MVTKALASQGVWEAERTAGGQRRSTEGVTEQRRVARTLNQSKREEGVPGLAGLELAPDTFTEERSLSHQLLLPTPWWEVPLSLLNECLA